MLKGTCTFCEKGQEQIDSGKLVGDLNSLLNSGKLPETHLKSHNYTGPFTKLQERLLRGDTPVNDMTYSIFKDKKDVFDKKST